MQQNSTAFQDALARAKQIAQKLSAAAPNTGPVKRPTSDDDPSSKRPAFDDSSPVLRAQLVAQKISSQLGLKSSGELVPLSNQLGSQDDYHIPDKYVGLIIGKGGEQITRIQQETGCKVQISPLRTESANSLDGPERIANLSGTRDAIERARKVMDDIVSRGRAAENGANPYSMSSSKAVEVMLPSAKCGLIIGKGGENIRRIMDEYTVKLFVGQETIDIDGIEHKPLKITGDADKAERARQHVLDMLSRPGPNSAAARAAAAAAAGQSTNSSYGDYGSRSDVTPGAGPCSEAVYHVPYDKAGIIIGKGGETIKEINRKSGAYVELDKLYVSPLGTPPERIFKLRGTPEQVVTAQQLMYERVANSACGASDLQTPILFQTQFNLPLVGNTPMDGGWGASASADPNGAADPYSQWAAAFAQWPQTGANSAANPVDPSAMTDPAWLAYYQSMNYYSMMQSNVTSTALSTSTTTTKPTDSTAESTAATTTTSGQPDYTQQWIEYYRSVGQSEYADQIAQQVKDGSASAWAAYAQQWSNGAATAAPGSTSTSNGNSTSS